MSYILDALKKSEAQRHAGRIPTAVAVQGASIESPRATGSGVLGWTALALAVALGIAWAAYRLLDRMPGNAAAPQAATVAPAASADSPPAQSADAREARSGGEVIPRLKLASSLPAQATTPAPPVATPGEPAMRAIQATRAAPPPAPAREPHAPGAARGALLPYADLPPAIRQAMPPLVVGGFAAGESGGAMVVIDDKLVREGDEVAPGIRVEKILSDTAEFSYKGYRFRR